MAEIASIPNHKNFQDLTGRKFGRLAVVSYAGKRGHERAWNCVCDCGGVATTLAGNLKRGQTASCGCLHREVTGYVHRTHGLTSSSEYHIYQSMLARCYYERTASYKYYGARGIGVCDRWRYGENGEIGFVCFYRDMGHKPSSDHSIEREDNDGNYEPGNCIWSTKLQQAQNTRRTRYVELNGTRMKLREALKIAGISRDLFYQRTTRCGWSVQQALTKPSLQARK